MKNLTKQQRRELFAGQIFARQFFHKRWSQFEPMKLLRIANKLEGYATFRAAGMAGYARKLARKAGASCKEHLQRYAL